MAWTIARVRRAAWLRVLLLVLLWGAACSNERRDSTILVAAASDLAGAMPELVAAFEAGTGVRVETTLGSTGQLAQQVMQGAPVDVFLSADEEWIDRLEGAGRVVADSRRVYAHGVIVLLAGRVVDPPRSLAELTRPEWGRIALANPEHAPYGRGAREALEQAGIYQAVSSRLVLAENVRQTVQFAETGAVDVAMSALSLMDSTKHRWTVLPAGTHLVLTQTAAVVAGRGRTEEAAAFVEFLTTSQGREILARHRFVLP